MGNRSSRSASPSGPTTVTSEEAQEQWELTFVEQTVNRSSLATALKKSRSRRRGKISWGRLAASRKTKINMDNLHKLAIVKCFVDAGGSLQQLQHLVRDATNLNNLHLETHGHTHVQEDSTLDVIADLILAVSESHTSLESLTVSTLGQALNSSTGLHIQQILLSNKNLSQLHLSLTGPDNSKMIQDISEGITQHRKLKLLSLTGSDITDEEFAKFLAPSVLTLQSIEALDISNNQLTSDSLPLLADLVNKGLHYLDISQQPIFGSDVEMDVVSAFMNAIGKSQKLEYLSVNSCSMGDDPALELIKLLDREIPLQQLDVGFNKIGRPTLLSLIQIIPKMTNVLKLKIHGLRISTWTDPWTLPEGQALLQSLALNQSIHCISIDSNTFFNKNEFGTLEAILRRNFLLEKVKKSTKNEGSVPCAMIPYIMERLYSNAGLQRKAGHTVNQDIFRMVRYEWMPFMCGQSAH